LPPHECDLIGRPRRASGSKASFHRRSAGRCVSVARIRRVRIVRIAIATTDTAWSSFLRRLAMTALPAFRAMRLRGMLPALPDEDVVRNGRGSWTHPDDVAGA